uniref:ARAD1B18436p n=1 Tax=Blastobotrys adeninivorans TaxID=409370 RepID=A0A060T6H0_BLAAD
MSPNGLRVRSVQKLLGVQIGAEIEYYQRIVDNIGALGGPSESELVGVSLDSAIVRVAKIVARNSETPIALGPVTPDFVAGHHLQLNVPQKSLKGYGIAPVTTPDSGVSDWVGIFDWGELGDCFVQGGGGISWNLVPDRDELRQDREARGLPYNESKPTINNGWIELKHLTFPGLRAVYDRQEVHGRLPAVPEGHWVDNIYLGGRY